MIEIVKNSNNEFRNRLYQVSHVNCSCCNNERVIDKKDKLLEKFIEKANNKHDGKYDYSKVEYVNNRSKVCIICSIHGEFYQTPSQHLNSLGCSKCSGRFNLNQEEFIKRAIEFHNGKYDYAKVKFIKSTEKVCIICPTHGDFWQTPNDHLHNSGCKKCGTESMKKKTRFSTEEFITKAKNIHGDKFNYSKVDYINSQTKVCIVCPDHGNFYQIPNAHLRGQGCERCHRPVYDTESFIKKAIELYGNKFDYSKVVYVKSSKKVCIICPIHGEFFQTPNGHLSGEYGCEMCAKDNYIPTHKLTTEEFIQKVKEVYGDKYDYSKVNYKNELEKVCIICPIHGEFWRIAVNHLKRGCECPGCSIRAGSKLEFKVESLLKDNHISYIPQMEFDWLKYKSSQYLDFYLPDYNVAIECQGEQHFKSIEFFGGDEGLKLTKLRDSNKFQLCKDNGIKILYFSDYKYEENIITNLEELLSIIRSIEKYSIP